MYLIKRTILTWILVKGLIKPRDIMGTVCKLFNRQIESMDDVQSVLSVIRYSGVHSAVGHPVALLEEFGNVVKTALEHYLKADGRLDLAISRTKTLVMAVTKQELKPIFIELCISNAGETMPPLTVKVNTCYASLTMAFNVQLAELARFGITTLKGPFELYPAGYNLTWEEWWEHQITYLERLARNDVYTAA